MKLLNNRIIIGIFLIWRLFLFFPLLISEKFLSPRPGFDFASPFHFLSTDNIASHFLLSPFANFDGIYYLIIAERGYTVDSVGFFPLFPFIIKIVNSIFGDVNAFDPG